MMGETETITIPGKLENLDVVADFVMAAAAEAKLDYRSSYCLRLAVDEIATNIILHDLGASKQGGTLTLTAELNEDYLTIFLEDTGHGYNPYEALPPDNIHGPPEERQIGGWGIYLAIMGVDEFHYARSKGKNCSTFRMQRQSKAL